MRALFLYFEYLGALVRVFILNKLGMLYRLNPKKRFMHNGCPTYYLHTIWTVKPDYVHRVAQPVAMHFYRTFKNNAWKTIKSKTKLN